MFPARFVARFILQVLSVPFLVIATAAPSPLWAQVPAEVVSHLRSLPPQAQHKKVLRRYLYFYEPRAFPARRIAPGALSRARRDHEQKFGPLRPPQGAGRPAQDAWTSIGPAPITPAPATSGPISSIAIDPGNSNVIYVGAAIGGVWKSSNGGSSWTPLTDTQCSTAIASIAIDPLDTRIIYAGTGERHFAADSYYGCGLLKSTDGGASWTQVGATQFDAATGAARIHRIAVHPTTAGIVLVATDFGLFRTTDAGVSFTLVQAGSVSDVAFDPRNPTIAHAAVGGVSGGGGNGVYKSTNSGAAFTGPLRGGFPSSDVGRISMAIAPSNPLVLYAAVHSSDLGKFGSLRGIFKTADGGMSWTAVAATGASCNFQCWYGTVLVVDPIDPETVYFGAEHLFRSTDGGTSFFEVTRTMHGNQHAIAFLPGTRTTILAGNDGGIFKSSDGGATWFSLNANLEITRFHPGVSLHPTDPNIALGGTQGSHTLQFTGADTWLTMPFKGVGGCDGGFTLIAAAQFAQCEWQAGALLSGPRRLDGLLFERVVAGININDDGLFVPPLVGSPSSAPTLYFGLTRLYKSVNSGERWSALADLGGNITAIAEAPGDARVVYAGTSTGAVRVSRDGGTRFAPQGSGLPARVPTDFAIHPGDPATAYVVLSGFGAGHVFKTTNAGATWTDISGNLPDVPANAIVIDPAAPTTGLLVATDLGVYLGGNGGANWTPFNAGLPNVPVHDLAYNPATGMLVAATHGRGAFKAAFPGATMRPSQ
jgi:photosystem II stability/assembly factor-like uncharacterized protein